MVKHLRYNSGQCLINKCRQYLPCRVDRYPKYKCDTRVLAMQGQTMLDIQGWTYKGRQCLPYKAGHTRVDNACHASADNAGYTRVDNVCHARADNSGYTRVDNACHAMWTIHYLKYKGRQCLQYKGRQCL